MVGREGGEIGHEKEVEEELYGVGFVSRVEIDVVDIDALERVCYPGQYLVPLALLSIKTSVSAASQGRHVIVLAGTSDFSCKELHGGLNLPARSEPTCHSKEREIDKEITDSITPDGSRERFVLHHSGFDSHYGSSTSSN